jgi:two-component sensor histidine kinase/putative methionine-R-sulfoxide reductase with GAF domain
MRSPIRARRLLSARRRSDNPDVNLLQQELESAERQLREARMMIGQLRTALEEKSGEADALRRVGEATGSAFDLEEMLKVTADIAIQVTGTDSCQVYLYDKARDELVLRAADETAQSMIGKIRLKLGEGITGWVARERKHVAVIRNASQDHRFKYFPEIREEEYESMLSVPLVAKNEVIGVINVRTRRPRAYTKNQVRLLSGIASQVAGAIEKANRARQWEKTAVQLSTLSEVSQAIASNVYLNDLLDLFVQMTARTMNYRVCTVMLVDPEKNELVIKATQSESQEYTQKPNPKVGDSIAGRAVAEGRVMTVQDVKKHPEYRFPDVAKRAGLCSLASVPLFFQGRAIGVLNCYTEKPHIFSREEIAILQALGAQAAFAVEHAKLMVKSAVIQEMHHRVKNNLQQIASLVRLQMRYSTYSTVEGAMTDTLNRILAIAAVHELLSRDNLDNVSVKKVAEQILTATKQSVVPPDKSLYMKVEGPDIRLPLNQATSLALVINELVQNAVEHGFKHLDEGRIWVQLEEDEDTVRLTVINDGEPLPEGFDPTQTNSLGLRIVTDLVRGGLLGTFTMENRDGICAMVTFPKA